MNIPKLFSILLTVVLSFTFLFGAAIEKEKIVMVKAGDHFRFGVVVSDINKDKHEVKVESGAYVLKVLDESPAGMAGVKDGDVIVNFDGKKINSAEDLENCVSDIKETKEVTVIINREGKEQSIKAKMEKVSGEKNYTVTIDDNDFDFHTGVMPSSGSFDILLGGADEKGGFLGVQAKDISESMLGYFEVEYGVLIEEVVKESPAEKAGFKSGDVITKINDREIKDYNDLIRTLNFYNPGEKVTVHYSRKGSKKTVSVTLGEKKGSAKNMKIKKMFKKGPGLNWIDEDNKNIIIDEDVEHTPGFHFFEKGDALRLKII